MEPGSWVCRHCSFRSIPGLPRPLLCPDDGLPLIAEELLGRHSADPLLGRILAGRFALVGFVPGRWPVRIHEGWRLPAGGTGLASATEHDLPALEAVSVHTAPDEVTPALPPDRFAQLARQLSSFAHPGLLSVHEHGLLPEIGNYLVTESYSGETLSRRLGQGPQPVGWAEAWSLLRPCVEALVLPHRQGVVHGMIEPHRLLLPRAGGSSLRLMGLGLEQLFGPPAEDRRGSQLPVNLDRFTALSLSPEQIRQRPLGPASDVYSLGCLLHLLVTGEPPFPGSRPLEIVSAHLEGRYPGERLAAVAGAELAAVLGRACATDPNLRLAHAAELLRELDQVPRPGGLVPDLTGDGTVRLAPARPEAAGLPGARSMAGPGGAPHPAPPAGPPPRRDALRPLLPPTGPSARTPPPLPQTGSPSLLKPQVGPPPRTSPGQATPAPLPTGPPVRTPTPRQADRAALPVEVTDRGEVPVLRPAVPPAPELPEADDDRTVQLAPQDLAQLAAALSTAVAAPARTGAGELPPSPLRPPPAELLSLDQEATVRFELPVAEQGPAGLDDLRTIRLPSVTPEMLQAALSQAGAGAPRGRPTPLPASAEPPGGTEQNTVMLNTLDPELLRLQAEYQERQDEAARRKAEAAQEAEEAARAAERQQRRQKMLARTAVLGTLLLGLAGGGGWWWLHRSEPEQHAPDPELQAFLDGLETSEDRSGEEQGAQQLREQTQAELAELVGECIQAEAESKQQLRTARSRLEGGRRRAVQELLGLADEVKTIRREALELKLALAETDDERLPGLAANAQRLHVNLIEVRASSRAALDELLEQQASRGGRPGEPARSGRASTRPPGPGNGVSDPSSAPSSGGDPSVATLDSAGKAAAGQLSDEELLRKVLGAEEQGAIAVAGLDCGCDPDRLTRAVDSADLGACELKACWKVPPGNQRFSDVALTLSRYHKARRQGREELLALVRATSFGRYSHDPGVLFVLIAVAAREGRFKVALEAKDRFLYLKELLPPAERQRKVPEAFRILGLAFEHRFYRMMEDNPDKADPAMLHRAIDYLERYMDSTARTPELESKLEKLRKLQQEHASP